MSILKTKKSSSPRLKDLKKTINPPTIVTLNILIDSELHKKFKVKTTMNGETMTDVIINAIKGYLK